jgi:archaellum biogenesis protein FlaJ (TadC family)
MLDNLFISAYNIIIKYSTNNINRRKGVLEMTKKQCYFTDRQVKRIQAYADAYGISFAEALRRILDQLLFTNSRGGDN